MTACNRGRAFLLHCIKQLPSRQASCRVPAVPTGCGDWSAQGSSTRHRNSRHGLADHAQGHLQRLPCRAGLLRPLLAQKARNSRPCAGYYQCNSAVEIARPGTKAELADIVQRYPLVKGVGVGHRYD